MKDKQGQEPAFAKSAYVAESSIDPPQEGMSKRFYAACAAMQGLCSTELQGITIQNASERCPRVVALAYQYADELLKQEEQ